MAHEIERRNDRGTHSFYSLKEMAWHGLGTVVQEAKKPSEVMKIANLDYIVALAPMYASFIPQDCTVIKNVEGNYYVLDANGNQIIEQGQPLILPKKGVEIPTHFTTFRTDNFEPLGVVGSRYEPVQNETAIDFIFDICKGDHISNKEDIIIETAGVLGRGERIFVTSKLPSYYIGNDEMLSYILFTTSHDGSGMITAAFTNIRVVCNNTLNAALRSTKNKLTFKHTKNVRASMKEAAETINSAMMYSKVLKETLTYAQSINITDSIVTDYILDLLLDVKQIAYLKDKGGIEKIKPGDSIISTIKQNQFWTFKDYMDRGVGQDVYRGTAYWMYNGITTYLNNGIKYKNNQDKFDSITDGNSFKINQKAFDLLSNKVLTEQY